MNEKDIQISDYNYSLPEERIAKFPIAQRDHSKLLVYRNGAIEDHIFYDIPEMLPKGSLMVYNNTRVIQARLHFRKETGALIEVFLLEPYSPTDYELMFQTKGVCEWLCLVGNLKKWKAGVLERNIKVNGKDVKLTAEYNGKQGTSHVVILKWDDEQLSFADIIDVSGELPIPPYLNRNTEESDKTTYQTVYSKIKGSVAAPTAGLHFTEVVLKDIDGKGVEREELTLHVGAGTFRPVKSEKIADHDMHTEYVSVTKHTIERILAHDCCAIAVGTTSVRTLESLYFIGCHILRKNGVGIDDPDLHVEQWEPYSMNIEWPSAKKALEAIVTYLDKNGLHVLNASTRIIICPGYKFKIVKMLITNFHQPQSTLLLLVSALIGDNWRCVYNHALDNDYRFLSYGDSSLLIP